MNATVLVLDERKPRGDIGPCCDQSCLYRATTILSLSVNGLLVTAWACDKHKAFA